MVTNKPKISLKHEDTMWCMIGCLLRKFRLIYFITIKIELIEFAPKFIMFSLLRQIDWIYSDISFFAPTFNSMPIISNQLNATNTWGYSEHN